MSSNLMNKIRKNRLGKINLPKSIPKTDVVVVENVKKTVEPDVETKEMVIQRLAEEELLREAQRGATRAELEGPTGWLKCPLLKTNKRFLKNTLKTAVSHNNYKERKNTTSSHREKKLSGNNGVHKRKDSYSEIKRDVDKNKSSHRSSKHHDKDSKK